MVEEVCPMVTTIHGGEHIMSLGFSDIAKTRLGGMMVKLCRVIYKWFGGRHHALYALVSAFSKMNNKGIPIGLIRPADTRMGGYWIAWTRIYRMKAVFEQMLVSQQFTQKLKNDQKPPESLVGLLRDPGFWDSVFHILRALHGPLRVLRYCDMKTTVMDKLFYLCSRALD